MNRILALLWKDLRLFFGDPKAMLITFLVPIGIASFFGSVFGGATSHAEAKTHKIPVLVVNEDHDPLVDKIVDGLRKDSMADPTVVDEKTANGKVADGSASVAIVFPKGFGNDAAQAMFNGDSPQVDLRYDPSKSMEMQAVQGSIMQVAMKVVSQAAFSSRRDYSPQIGKIDQSTTLTAAQKADFHAFFDDLRRINAFTPAVQKDDDSGAAAGIKQPFELTAHPQTASTDPEAERKATLAHTFAGMAVQGVLFYAINAAMTMLSDRRKGIWRRLRAAPVSLTELLMGKAFSSALIGGSVLIAVLLFGFAFFGIRVSGSFLGLALVVAATAAMVSAFGLLVASLGRTEEQSRGLSIMAVLAMVMLGGAWLPSFLMPAWVQKLSLLVPVRWSLDGFDGMLWRGQGLSAVWSPVAGLLVFAAVFGTVAAFRFRTMPETA